MDAAATHRWMRRALVAIGIALGAACSAAHASAPAPATMVATPLPSLGATAGVAAPGGWLDLCNRTPDFCKRASAGGEALALNVDAFRLLASINAEVNRQLEPASDQSLYGKDEHWVVPVSGKGDCEDSALLKRERLHAAGVPLSALLITIVRTAAGENHAVLTVITDKGDFILDNQHDRVALWHETGYRFLARQSRLDQNLWQALNGPRMPATVASRTIMVAASGQLDLGPLP